MSYNRKMFTHTDMDGAGCCIALKSIYPRANVQFCTPKNVNSKIEKWIDDKKYKFFESCIISDLSVDDKVASKIDEANKDNANIIILDHHESSSDVSKSYKWYKEVLGDNSAASLVYYWLLHTDLTDTQKNVLNSLYPLINLIRLYDTWEWVESNNELPNTLNKLYWILGRELFISKYLKDPSPYDFNDTENFLLANYDQKCGWACKSSYSHAIHDYKLGDHNVCFVTGNSYIDEICHYILDSEDYSQHDESAVVLLNYPTGISVRSTDGHTAEDISEEFGGGGHGDSAGIPITKNPKVADEVIKMIKSTIL